MLSACCAVICATGAAAQGAQPNDTQAQRLEQQFQAAQANYNAGHLTEASTQLEALLPLVPKNFAVHELLGLVYAAQSQDAKAIEQFTTAVDLKPASAIARSNLAAAFLHAGKPDLAGEQFIKAHETRSTRVRP